MEACGKTVVAPYHFLIARHFEELYRTTLGMITGDNRVAVGQPLRAAGVIEQVLADVLVVNTPHDLTLPIHLNNAVAIGTADERVTIRKPNGSKRPIALGAAAIVGGKAAHHLAGVRFVFLHGKIQQMRRNIISIGQQPQHPRLHVEIFLLTRKRRGLQNLALAIDDNRPRLRPR